MKISIILTVSLLACSLRAAWYWPFGSGDEDEKPRLSELVEQASLEIEDAIEASSEGDLDKALEHYRKALDELERVERENPAIIPLPEYSSLRNKRAYVNAAIDSILLEQSRDNAKAVQVTNTAELEKKFAARRLARQGGASPIPAAVPAADAERESKSEEPVKDPPAEVAAAEETPRVAKRNASMPLMSAEEIDKRLKLRPDDAKALNMRAMLEVRRGDYKAAEETLYQAIMTNPRGYHAYYNMAALILKHRPTAREAARRYYETGRNYGGPVHKGLEKEFR